MNFTSGNALGFLGGRDLVFGQHAGVYGESDQRGVFGNSDTGFGVAGLSASGTGIHGVNGKGASTNLNVGSGILGESEFGNGVSGVSERHIGVFAKGPVAGRFEGNVEVTGDIQLVNADVAEDFTVAAAVEPGTVMVIDDEGLLTPCRKAYDTRVVGVISGAGDYRPAVVLDRHESLQERAAVALVGKAYCKIDAKYGAIQIGDLLTTSLTAGCAMKARDPVLAFGAVIGKALRPMATGQGRIPILIALQ
jgi:hypothetical protein